MAYSALTLVLVSLPLVSVLHAESSAIVAGVAFFVAGWTAIRSFQNGQSFWHVLLHQESALLVPLVGLTVSMLWAPNCAYRTGLLFFALFPVISVGASVSLAYLLTGLPLQRPRVWLVGLGVAVAVGGPLVDIGLHPQFYTYNHVFGGVLGPMYDEQLAMRPGLFVFRGLTLLWSGLAVIGGAWSRGGPSPRWAGGMILALSIGMMYAFRAPLGLNTPEAYTQQRLGGHHATAHFDVYYAPEALTDAQVQMLAADQERHYASLVQTLSLAPDEEPERIAVYLYPSPDVKAALTGARATSVAPVWLPTPQVHLLQSRHEAHFRHELAHVFGRAFGLPLLKASWAVGLVEGWAEALEVSGEAPSSHDLVVAAAATGTGGVAARADAIADRLSPLGFWTGRGAVSYTTMGSFVRFLLDRYGPEPLKAAYATAAFEPHYGASLEHLAAEWAAMLQERRALNRSAYVLVTARFTRPSLFETTCPHYVPPARRHRQAAERVLATGDTTAALAALGRAVQAAPGYVAAHQDAVRLQLARNAPDAVVERLDTLEAATTDVGLLLARADAHALRGETEPARRFYAQAFEGLPRYAVAAQATLVLRDAIAHRPDVVRVLVRGASDAQARQLAQHADSSAAVQAWQALRWQAAGYPERALAVWKWVDTIASPDRPPLWHRTARLARLWWHAQAARDAGATDVTRQTARQAATAFRHFGHQTLAASLRQWATEPVAHSGRSGRSTNQQKAAAGSGSGLPLRRTHRTHSTTPLHVRRQAVTVSGDADALVSCDASAETPGVALPTMAK